MEKWRARLIHKGALKGRQRAHFWYCPAHPQFLTACGVEQPRSNLMKHSLNMKHAGACHTLKKHSPIKHSHGRHLLNPGMNYQAESFVTLLSTRRTKACHELRLLFMICNMYYDMDTVTGAGIAKSSSSADFCG